MKNDALSNQGFKQGIYQISQPINGKQSWTSGGNAIWYEQGDWVIGDLEDIGTNICAMSAIDAYGGLDDDNNVWQYYNPEIGWAYPGENNVRIDCTSKN